MTEPITQLSKWEMARDYLLANKERRELEKRHKLMEKEFKQTTEKLEGAKLKESALFGSIDQDSLFTAKTIKKLNQLLSSPHFVRVRGELLPLSRTRLCPDRGSILAQMVFAQPVFSGWETKEPYVSYQILPFSVVVPPKPSENHIPRFVSEIEQNLGELACWDLVDDKLVFHTMLDKEITFLLGAAVAPVSSPAPAASDPVEESLGESLEQWLERVKQS